MGAPSKLRLGGKEEPSPANFHPAPEWVPRVSDLRPVTIADHGSYHFVTDELPTNRPQLNFQHP